MGWTAFPASPSGYAFVLGISVKCAESIDRRRYDSRTCLQHVREQLVSDGNEYRAEKFLKGLVGRRIVSLEKNEHQLRLLFDGSNEFVAGSAWRFLQANRFLVCSGDSAKVQDDALECLKGMKFISVSVCSSWETRISIENDYRLEMICDSIQYESWEAHLETGWAVFEAGEMTLFPPTPRADKP